MQKIRSILKIGNSGAVLCDGYGSEKNISLEMMLGTGGILEFELRSEAAGESALLPDYPPEEVAASVYYLALDIDCSNSDDPPLLITSGVTAARDSEGRTVMSVPVVSNATSRIAAALEKRSAADFICELGGFDDDGNSVFAWQFPLVIRSRVYLGGSSGETQLPTPAYYTAVQVDALIAGVEQQLGKIDVSAEKIPVADPGNYFSSGNIEGVVQEIGSQLEGLQDILEGI